MSQNEKHHNPQRRDMAALLLGAVGASVLQGCAVNTGPEPLSTSQTDTLQGGGGRLILASTLASPILPSNSGSTNSTRYAAWATDSNYASSTLVFDIPGTYEFAEITSGVPPLQVPALRTLNGVSGVTLKCVSTIECFIGPGGSPFFVDNLAIDGAGNADYLVQTAGTLGGGPGSAGATAFLTGLSMKNAVVACVRGYNAALAVRDCSTYNSPVGYLFEGCSESVGMNLNGNAHSDCAIRVRGSLGIPPGEEIAQPNGGRMSFYRIGGAPDGDYGLDLDGVAQCDVHGMTFEATNVAAVRIRNRSSNVHIFGMRSNGGAPLVFDGCTNSCAYGGCQASQVVKYTGGAVGCRAFFLAESHVGAFDITQEWTDGTTTWQGRVRPDGTLLTNDGSPPNVGTWMEGDIVWNDDFTVHAPEGWRYSGSVWLPFPQVPSLVECTAGGQQNVDGASAITIQGALYQLNGGYDGQVVVVVNAAGSPVRLSESSMGNIQIDGAGAPGTLWRNMSPRDTVTLVRLPTGSSYYWRETAKSTA